MRRIKKLSTTRPKRSQKAILSNNLLIRPTIYHLPLTKRVTTVGVRIIPSLSRTPNCTANCKVDFVCALPKNWQLSFIYFILFQAWTFYTTPFSTKQAMLVLWEPNNWMECLLLILISCLGSVGQLHNFVVSVLNSVTIGFMTPY